MNDVARLSARELEVVALIAEGLQDAEIGARLFLAPSTIGTHVKRALARTGMPNRAGLVAWAFRTGAIR